MGAYRTARFAFGLAVCAAAGCATPPAADHAHVARSVESRFGHPANAHGARADRAIVPEGLERGEPLTDDQAVVLALWNNAQFPEQLVELDLTRSDLIQAGLLPNPEFVYFWPVPNKPFKYALEFPIEAIWLRPLRLKVTAAENDRAAARLTQLADLPQEKWRRS